ncbi:MAG: peptide deformylase [Prevotellaceae bacterium]|jgi:peptide deformylase|nr:peptide deformylase [Prevotellaceae bacterium]
MKKIIWLWYAVAGVMLISCCRPAVFSGEELLLINQGTAQTPFRVLQITDPQDAVRLRTPCGNVENFAGDSTLALLIARLKTTLIAENGVGIAASQVGVLKNIFLFMRLDLPGAPVTVAINPEIINRPDTTVCFDRDGCLSIPGISGNSVRYPWVEVEYSNEQGECFRERLEGYSRQGVFTAVIFQHEYDHTRGILFIDKLCNL